MRDKRMERSLGLESTPSKIVVIGGGPVGLATAFYLQKADCDVTVVEAGCIGQATSLGSGGWLSRALTMPTPAPGIPLMALRETLETGKAVSVHPLAAWNQVPWMLKFLRNCRQKSFEEGCTHLARLSALMWEGFDEVSEAGAAFDMYRAGNVRACFSEREASEQLKELAPMRRAGIRVPDRLLPKAELHELEPAFSDRVQSGFFLDEDRHVDPQSFTAALGDVLRRRGVTMLENCVATDFERSGGRVRAVITAGGRLSADAVVIATGLWSRAMAAKLDADLPMRAGKGYSFLVRLPQQPVHAAYLSNTKVGLTPIQGGVRVAGAMEIAKDNLHFNHRIVRAMVKVAGAYLQTWPADLTERTVTNAWVGMRPMTPDGLPIIDRLPAFPNAFVCTGHGMTGVGLSLVSGARVAEYVTSGARPDELNPFTVGRFRGNSISKASHRIMSPPLAISPDASIGLG